MCGAGISVSAGIPDFRSPGMGLYSKLDKYDIPHPQAIFEIDFFRRNPLPFFALSRVSLAVSVWFCFGVRDGAWRSLLPAWRLAKLNPDGGSHGVGTG